MGTPPGSHKTGQSQHHGNRSGEGPVPKDAACNAQGLLDLHRNLEARAATTYPSPSEPSEQTMSTDTRDRVLGTGARTSRSLAADAQRQAEHRQKLRLENQATENP